jgi:hypothetical protein
MLQSFGKSEKLSVFDHAEIVAVDVMRQLAWSRQKNNQKELI